MIDPISPPSSATAPRPWESVGLVFVQMLALLAAGIMLGVVGGFVSVGQTGLLIFTLVGELLLVFPLMIWIAVRKFPWRATLRWQPASWKMVALGVGLGVTIWPLATAVSLPFEWVLSQIGPAPELPVPENLLQAILLGVTVMFIAPLVEEPMFRGFVMRGWQSMGSWVAIVVSGILFGLLHGQLAQFPALTFVGIVLGIIALRAGSIIPAMVMHGVFNALSFFSLFNASWLESIPDTALLLISAAILPLFIIFLVWLFRTSSAKNPPISMPDEFGWLLVALAGFGVMGLFAIFAILDIMNRWLSPLIGGL